MKKKQTRKRVICVRYIITMNLCTNISINIVIMSVTQFSDIATVFIYYARRLCARKQQVISFISDANALRGNRGG